MHGGAVSLYLSAEEAPFDIRALENIEAKTAIALAAVDLLVEGETVILDGGSTTMEVARSMRQRRLTVMPLALRPVLELDGCQGIKLLIPGGEVRTKELSLVGSLSEHAFSQLRFDTFVMGICGIDAVAGVTTQMLAEAEVKRAAAKAARSPAGSCSSCIVTVTQPPPPGFTDQLTPPLSAISTCPPVPSSSCLRSPATVPLVRNSSTHSATNRRLRGAGHSWSSTSPNQLDSHSRKSSGASIGST